jgi:hypothetical protein
LRVRRTVERESDEFLLLLLLVALLALDGHRRGIDVAEARGGIVGLLQRHFVRGSGTAIILLVIGIGLLALLLAGLGGGLSCLLLLRLGGHRVG